MSIFVITPALVKKSLRARVRGQKPHLPDFTIDRYILDCWEGGGALPRVSPKDYAESVVDQRRNNRMNAALRNKKTV